jgi:ATP diphosphatase
MAEQTPPDRSIDRLLRIMARLRDPKTGCPWDRQQTFKTIAPYTIEEAYEVADAIDRQNMDALKDELGDLLFQVVFYAQMSHESGGFDFHAIAEAISDKMERRHPHVFGDAINHDKAQQTLTWEALKAEERENTAGDGRAVSALDGVARALPALMRAEKLQNRAARVGFDWPEIGPVYEKIDEEIEEVKSAHTQAEIEEELGDLMFAVVNLARHHGVDAEHALRRGNDKFEARFRQIEDHLTAAGKQASDCSLEELEALWTLVKNSSGKE